MLRPPKIPEDNPYLLNLLVRSYMEGHVSKWYGSEDPKLLRKKIGWYSGIMTHILISSGNHPLTRAEIGESIEKAVKGKRILHLGCREGLFLDFLKDHGAVVAGTTSEKYLDSAKGMIGSKAILVDSTTERAGELSELRAFKPHLIISANYFDKARWGKKMGVPQGFIRSVGQLAARNTQIFVLPAFDTDPIDHEAEFRRGFGRIEVLRHSEHIYRRGKPYATYRMSDVR